MPRARTVLREDSSRRRAAQAAQQVAAGQLLLHDPEVRLAMGPEQEAEAYERLNELEASIGLPPTPYVDVPKQEFAKQIHAGQVTVAERALPAGEREALLDGLADATIARFGPERVARYLVDLRNQQTLAQAAMSRGQGKPEPEVIEPPMEARQWVRSLIEPYAPPAVEDDSTASRRQPPLTAYQGRKLVTPGATPTGTAAGRGRLPIPEPVRRAPGKPRGLGGGGGLLVSPDTTDPARRELIALSASAKAAGGPTASQPLAARTATPAPVEQAVGNQPGDAEQIAQRRQGYLATAGDQMRIIVDPYASGKDKQAANAELLEKAFDLSPNDAARIAALPPPQQIAELKKMKVIEANADQSQSAWAEMITARMLPEGVDPKSPEGKALAQQTKQFANDTWNCFRLQQPSAEAAKAAVQGKWAQYVAKARTYYANAGVPYDEDAVKRVLFLAGDTKAFEHAKATGKAPVGAGFVPPTDIVGERGLDPEFARRLAALQAAAAKEGIEVRLAPGDRSGYRTAEDQEHMRGARPGFAAKGMSTHEVGHGHDLDLYVDGKPVGKGAKEWQVVGRLARENGLCWGKTFSTPEEWHVQLYPPLQDSLIPAPKKSGGGKGGGKGGAPAPQRGGAAPTTRPVAPPSVGAPAPGTMAVTLTAAPSPEEAPAAGTGAPGTGGATQPAGKPATQPAGKQAAGKQAGAGAKKSKGVDPSKAVAKLPEDPKVLAAFLDECQKTGVDPALALSVGWWETRGKWEQGEHSGKGAHGIMQLMPGTAKAFGAVEPTDPVQNVRAGVKYLAYLLGPKKYAKYKDKQVDYVVAAYNWGEGNLDDHIKAGKDLSTAPHETRDYLVAVHTLMLQYKVLLAPKPKQPAGGAGGKK